MSTFYSESNKDFGGVELFYNCIWKRWFCRVWHKKWLERIDYGIKEYGEAHGKNKFEAYRKAVKDLRSI